jgi:hypothetical protein
LLECLLLRPPENLVGVTHYTRPAQLTHTVDDLVGLSAHESEVAAMEYEIGRASLNVT